LIKAPTGLNISGRGFDNYPRSYDRCVHCRSFTDL
jgi:hypothetical protein